MCIGTEQPPPPSAQENEMGYTVYIFLVHNYVTIPHLSKYAAVYKMN